MTPINFQVKAQNHKLLVFENILTAQYLFTPKLESCHTLYKLLQRMPLETNVQVTWSKVKVKLVVFGKRLSSQYLDYFAGKLTNLVHCMPPREQMFPNDIQVMWWKVKVKLLIFSSYVLQNLLVTLFDFREIMPIALWVTRSNYWSSSPLYPLNILWTICLIITILATNWVSDDDEWSLINRITGL